MTPPRKAAAPAKRAAKKTTKRAAKKAPARAAKKAAPPRKAAAKKSSKRARGPVDPIKSASPSDSNGSTGRRPRSKTDLDDSPIGSALRALLEAGQLPTNSVAVDAAIVELELDDDDPRQPISVLARRLARHLDIDSTNAALVREYRQTLIALLPVVGGEPDAATALVDLRRTLADS